MEIYEVDSEAEESRNFSFLKKIYDSTVNKETTIESIKNKSFLKSEVNEIIKRTELLDEKCGKV